MESKDSTGPKSSSWHSNFQLAENPSWFCITTLTLLLNTWHIKTGGIQVGVILMAACQECSTAKGRFILVLDHITPNIFYFLSPPFVLLLLSFFYCVFFLKQRERERANATISCGFKTFNLREGNPQLMIFGIFWILHIFIAITEGCCCINHWSKRVAKIQLFLMWKKCCAHRFHVFQLYIFIFIPFYHENRLFASDSWEMESVLLQCFSSSVEVSIFKALAMKISLPWGLTA